MRKKAMEQEVSASKRGKKEKTIMQRIEAIVEGSYLSKLNAEDIKHCGADARALGRTLGISEMQAILLSAFLDKSYEHEITLKDIADSFKCRAVKVLCYMDDIEALKKKGYIRERRVNWRNDQSSYRVPEDVVAALRKNMPYEAPSLQGLSQEAFYDRLRVLFDQVENNDLSDEELSESLGEMVDLNPSLEVCKGIKHYKITNGYDCSLVLLLFFCHKQVNDDDDRVSFHDIEQIFSESMDYQHVRRMLKSGRHELLHKKIIVQNRTTDLVSREYFGLSDEAKGVLMSELNLEMKSDREDKHLLRHGDIVEKALFYNDAERDEVAQLAELLSEKHFAWIQRRLKRSGMRSGFACLFYGAPGTGKTETVYQLARQTGRDIIMVNVSEIKSMWVGESEKNIKGLFDRYRAYCKHCERIPILLFNEADAVLGTRQENVQRAVDKMENSIQNIILQEMETLDGIMIATTNLTENLDKAFERRFLYKIAFMKPCIEAKTSIWQSMMPKLSDVIAEELSRCYDFSGGEIENIVRRATIEHILKGKRPTLEVLHRYCKGEKMERGNRHKRVGF